MENFYSQENNQNNLSNNNQLFKNTKFPKKMCNKINKIIKKTWNIWELIMGICKRFKFKFKLLINYL